MDDLTEILTQPANALIKLVPQLFAVDGVDLSSPTKAVQAIADTAIKQGIGARGLRSIIERTLQDTMFQLPSLEDVKQVVVDKAFVEGAGAPKLLRETVIQNPRSRSSYGMIVGYCDCCSCDTPSNQWVAQTRTFE